MEGISNSPFSAPRHQGNPLEMCIDLMIKMGNSCVVSGTFLEGMAFKWTIIWVKINGKIIVDVS